jgi:hypothetical protein
METSELEMTPPDSPKAKEEKKDAPPEEDLLADLFPTAPPRDRSSIFYDREYWSNYKTPEDSGDTFHAQNGEPKSPESRARARERWPRLKAFSKSNCCA